MYRAEAGTGSRGERDTEYRGNRECSTIRERNIEMSLKRATLFFIAGSCYLFLSRTAGTIWPGFWRDLAVARISASLSFLAALTAFLFFIAFHGRYTRPGQIELRNATMLAIVGTALFALLHGKGLLVLFDLYPYQSIARIRIIEAVIPVAGALMILLFFVTLYGETFRTKEEHLKRPILLAMIGSAATALMRLFILIGYFAWRSGRWFSSLPDTMQYALYPVVIFGFVTLLYFLVAFYRSLDEEPAS